MNRIFRENKMAFLSLGLGLGLMGLGIFRQELVVVLIKASAICLECIGIG